jgi:phosphoribosyl 1,2-cyclic phosphate phosphodiesterase
MALVNDDLLLDAGPDLIAGAMRHGVDLAAVRTLLVTHPHGDHFAPSNLLQRRLAATPAAALEVYLSTAAAALVPRGEDGKRLEEVAVTLHPVSPFQCWDAGPGGRYRVWSFAANHGSPEMEAMLLAVQERGPGRTLLYATDTGPFPDATWEALERLRGAPDGLPPFDAVVVDATWGVDEARPSHMSIEQALAQIDGLARRGLLKSGAARLCHHFWHGGTPPHEELVEILAARGARPAYDGLTLEL